LYVNGKLVVNNDYPQGATQRCGAAVTLRAGSQTIYVEGWSRTAALSIAATFNGFDSLNSAIVIPGLWQCDPNSPSIYGSSFTMCGYKADNSINMGTALDLFNYYNQVRTSPDSQS
jgi:hypothetical protein